MKFLLLSTALLFLAAPQILMAEGETKALEAADDARVAATVKGDRDALEAVFSDDLRYAHSTGTVDDKASYVDLVSSGKAKYVTYDYVERDFTFPAPGIALMAGKVHIKSFADNKVYDSILSYLAVWRKENGTWKFLAWQSCKVPDPVPEAK